MTIPPRALALSLVLMLPDACSLWSGSGPGCEALAAPTALPAELDESSGVAVSDHYPGVYWTFNDQGESAVFAVDDAARIVGRVAVLHARHRDWEDMALGPCSTGSCLYLADVGDNYGERDSLTVYRIPEPEPDTAEVQAIRSTAFHFRVPGEPVNFEAVFLLPGERLFLVNKGSRATPALYRYPGPLQSDSVVTLERVQELGSGARALPRQITGASASRDGRVVAIRTYETLSFYRFQGDTLAMIPESTVSLRTFREGQGEAVGLGPEGKVVLTSEAGPLGGRGSMVVLRCQMPEGS